MPLLQQQGKQYSHRFGAAVVAVATTTATATAASLTTASYDKSSASDLASTSTATAKTAAATSCCWQLGSYRIILASGKFGLTGGLGS